MEIKTTGEIASEFIKKRESLNEYYLNNPETIKLIVDKKWVSLESIEFASDIKKETLSPQTKSVSDEGVVTQSLNRGVHKVQNKTEDTRKGCGKLFIFEDKELGIINLKCGEWVDCSKHNSGANFSKLEWGDKCQDHLKSEPVEDEIKKELYKDYEE